MLLQNPIFWNLFAIALAIVGLVGTFAATASRQPKLLAASGALFTVFFAVCASNSATPFVFFFCATITGLGSAFLSIFSRAAAR